MIKRKELKLGNINSISPVHDLKKKSLQINREKGIQKEDLPVGSIYYA